MTDVERCDRCSHVFVRGEVIWITLAGVQICGRCFYAAAARALEDDTQDYRHA
jgi:hypothetical protein